MRWRRSEQNLQQGRREVYDADLQSYFDTIPHEKLMAVVQKRIVDGSVLKLIRMWLKAVIVEPGERPGRAAEGQPEQTGNAAGRSDLSAAGQPVSALV